MSFFQNILSSVMKSTKRLNRFGLKSFGKLHNDINKAVESVMSTSGEVSSMVYAEHLLNLIEEQDDKSLIKFLKTLLSNYDIDTKKLLKDVKIYSSEKNEQNLKKIRSSSEPKWIELFRRLNSTTNGTFRLVKLRERIRALKEPELKTFDSGLLNLFKYWFNPSFLVLEKIDWETPANILEKIIEYEAVHEINSWDDLRARLAPSDRQCFAFFHPLIPNDPLIFVEVALCLDIPKSIQEVIKIDREEIDVEDANTAIFYSISNCHNGLLGISFGNFLIKKVAKNLKRELPALNQFQTLSPLPSLMKWMEEYAPITFERCSDKNCSDDELMKQSIRYLTESDRTDGMPNDPVARFHVGNGASLERINLHADPSEKGQLQSYGIMANYLYDLDVVEENHELFFKNKIVPISNQIKSLKK
ncbi:MAG: decarboxylase [SAR86 cluster bacterium]|jgi:malonyl-CoA decarboxylase|uniref:Decarboxylase n=1 Tax=SAR86 cluster bacterium TaxID=2030880 RepID=A0A520N4D5_9GAMM|nr:MAG: decarboxylase [SAR86 cluster bacterium]|tara:strand:+ start:1913 stop:3163 length:1251 start_codon:yes stop_codon:yes gene_type:complete